MVVDYVKDGKIAIFTINRPEARNALSVQVAQEMYEAMVDFRDDDNLWVGIVTGAGDKAFCAGADIKSTLPFMRENRDKPWAFPPTIMRGLEIWKPLIAAINGLALGGGLELALACDLRVASETARFGTTEVLVGLLPGWGGTQRLPRTIPKCMAAELLLTGKMIDAQEAYRLGLLNKVVAPDQVMPAAREYAETILQAAPLAVRAAKEAMVRGVSMTLEDGLKLENSLVSHITGTEDFNEGITAFTEKRKPEYKAK